MAKRCELGSGKAAWSSGLRRLRRRPNKRVGIKPLGVAAATRFALRICLPRGATSRLRFGAYLGFDTLFRGAYKPASRRGDLVWLFIDIVGRGRDVQAAALGLALVACMSFDEMRARVP